MWLNHSSAKQRKRWCILTNEKKQALIHSLRVAREKFVTASQSGESFSEIFHSKNNWKRLKRDAVGPCISTAIVKLTPKYNSDELINHLRKTNSAMDPIVMEVGKEAFGDDPYAFGINAVIIGEKATAMMMGQLVVDHYTQIAEDVMA